MTQAIEATQSPDLSSQAAKTSIFVIGCTSILIIIFVVIVRTYCVTAKEEHDIEKEI
eukprot:CAMPEP_0170491790 /NCGR_PEP_ID=MMETSP0208-20121228/11257_1 /TAXON_ID=197538 /ORGANISM="Strombidium inclinatum, Strain S3" /LENGTH=56 /DNA_ID=CAMNT_0010767421 /DNA_START=38 /DNA_END=208 /DNA_ORIENTATION=+